MSANLLFQDVLLDVMFEETTPSYNALCRWQDRYPDFRHELAQYFAAWAIQDSQPPQTDADAPEVPLDDLGSEAIGQAMETLRAQGRIIPGDAAKRLQPFDVLVLSAIVQLEGHGDPVDVNDRINEIAAQDFYLATVLGAI